MESLENLPSYHDVIANAMGNVAALIANKQEQEAHTLMKYLIVYSYTSTLLEAKPDLNEADLYKEVEKLNLKAVNDTMRLASIMSYHLSKAGMKPIQKENLFGKRFAKLRGKL